MMESIDIYKILRDMDCKNCQTQCMNMFECVGHWLRTAKEINNARGEYENK
jgi:hypothetical protein